MSFCQDVAASLEVVQHLHPFKLHCDQKHTKNAKNIERNANAMKFWPRANAAAIPAVKIKEQIEDEY